MTIVNMTSNNLVVTGYRCFFDVLGPGATTEVKFLTVGEIVTVHADYGSCIIRPKVDNSSEFDQSETAKAKYPDSFGDYFCFGELKARRDTLMDSIEFFRKECTTS